MSKLSYWERRKAQDMFNYMTSAEETADEISKLYLKASRYLSLEMDEIFERFQRKHKLSEAEAMELLNTLQDKTSLDELKRVLKAGGGDKTKAELLAELESPAYQARLERLQQLQNQIDLTMQQVYGQEKIKNTSHYADLANEAYYRSIFNIQQQTGFGFSFNAIDPAVINKVINSKWSGENYSTRIWKNTRALAQDLKEELLVNLITGRTDREAAEIIANKFGQGASNARRLVRTESCNLANQMDMASYGECGIETYIFVATLDLRTSSACRERDNKRYKVSEQQPGVNCPPMHPWCRSTTICDITDAELAQMKRRARDPVTGKTKMVPANMSYQEWYDQNVVGKPDAELKEKMTQNHSSDHKQFEQYKKILGEDAPKDIESFQKMKYTDSKKWDELKHEYRIVNQYEVVSGNVPPKKIMELHDSNMAARKEFSGGFGKSGNIATAQCDGTEYVAHSRGQDTNSKAYKKYHGSREFALLKEKRQFKTEVIDGWDRKVDGEAKIFEHLDATIGNKKTEVYLNSGYPMCVSCKGVAEQYKAKNPNVTVNIIQRKGKNSAGHR